MRCAQETRSSLNLIGVRSEWHLLKAVQAFSVLCERWNRALRAGCSTSQLPSTPSPQTSPLGEPAPPRAMSANSALSSLSKCYSSQDLKETNFGENSETEKRFRRLIPLPCLVFYASSSLREFPTRNGFERSNFGSLLCTSCSMFDGLVALHPWKRCSRIMRSSVSTRTPPRHRCGPSPWAHEKLRQI